MILSETDSEQSELCIPSTQLGCDNDTLIFMQGAIFYVPLQEVKGRQVYLHASTSDLPELFGQRHRVVQEVQHCWTIY